MILDYTIIIRIEEFLFGILLFFLISYFVFYSLFIFVFLCLNVENYLIV